ncbi:MAG: histidine kinase [bacterium]|nr:histidine kinase [bacterium]
MNNSGKYIAIIAQAILWVLLIYFGIQNFSVRFFTFKSIDGSVEYIRDFNWPYANYIIWDTSLKMVLFYGLTLVVFPKKRATKRTSDKLIPTSIFIFTLIIGLSGILILKSYEPEKFMAKPFALIGYSMLIHLFVLICAYAYRLIQNQREQEEFSRKAKEEQVKSELQFLKNQTNPHFLFNTLNNLYAEARKQPNESLTDGISRLSHLMRYMIYDSNVEKISLKKEIEFLKSYIELEKLRLSDDDPISIELECNDYNSETMIAPLLFIPFVENAFKHGLDLDEESYIKISLITRMDELEFKIANSNHKTDRALHYSGIGLHNIERRLKLIYDTNYSLDVDDGLNEFSVTLKLKIG